MNELGDKLEISKLQTCCHDLISGISSLHSQNNLYANLVSKLFGFRHMPHYTQMVKAFLRERQSYIQYYENEPEEQK